MLQPDTIIASGRSGCTIDANKNFAYLSSGTWSLMGIETDGPVVNEKTTHYNITNEGGVDGTIRLLKNITGMWIVEQCLKKWHKEGTDYNLSADGGTGSECSSVCLLHQSG